MRWFESSRPSTPFARGGAVVYAGLMRFLEALETGDLPAAAGCFAPDAVYAEVRGPALVGRVAIDAHFARYAAGGTPWSFTVDEVVTDRDRACAVYRFTGGEGPSRRERAGCALVRLDEGGRILEWREYER